MASTATEFSHILYHSTFSVCSLMVRLSYVYRGELQDAKDEIIVREEHIELGKKEQLTEDFLCDVNAYGEVPVLVPVNGKPIPDSLDITLYLAKSYPSLLPEEHSASIERLIRELHDINFFSLTFPGKPFSPLETLRSLRAQLEQNISERYRAAIQFKIRRVQREKLEAVAEDEVQANVKRTHAIMKELEDILKDSPTEWCFGLDRPSALDTHLLVFIARMQDVAQDDLIPASLQQWADNAMQKDEWKNLMQGKRTLPAPLLVSKRP